MVVLGVISFALLFLNELNDRYFGKDFLKILFPLAFLLLCISVGAELWHGVRGGGLSFFGLLCLAAALIFLALEVHSLFFALPRKESYTRPGEERALCSGGVYALCRHPGVLFFWGLMLFLWLTAGSGAGAFLLYSVLDALLALFEDTVVFPEKISGYDKYKAETPFIIPNRRSIARCLGK